MILNLITLLTEGLFVVCCVRHSAAVVLWDGREYRMPQGNYKVRILIPMHVHCYSNGINWLQSSVICIVVLNLFVSFFILATVGHVVKFLFNCGTLVCYAIIVLRN